jgi:hypothetical protein
MVLGNCYIRHHFLNREIAMIETKLTNHASLLYQWILPRVVDGEKLTIDLQDFQAWTAEYREKPLSDREILDALRQLKDLQLVSLSKTEVTLAVNPIPIDISSLNPQPPEKLLLETSDRHSNLKLFQTILAFALLGLASLGLSLTWTKLQPQNNSSPIPTTTPESSMESNP